MGYDLLIESGYVVKGSYMLAYVNTTIVNRITVLSSFLSEIQKGYPNLLGGIVNEQCYILLPTSHMLDLKHYPDLYVGYSIAFEKLILYTVMQNRQNMLVRYIVRGKLILKQS